MNIVLKSTICYVAMACLACANRGKPSPAPRDAQGEGQDTRSVSWSDLARGLATGINAFYSWRFYEEGRAHYTVAMHAETQNTACASYSPSGDRKSDYWSLSLYFGDAGAGTYQVGEIGSSNVKGRALEVSLLHRDQGKLLAHYKAVAGEVTIAVAPTFTDAQAGSKLHLTGWVAWPAVPRTTILCSGWYPVDGGMASGQASCRCQDPEGVESTCETELSKDCCAKISGPDLLRVALQPTEAIPCPGMCAFLAGQPDFCSQVLTPPFRDASVSSDLNSVKCNTSCATNTWPRVAVRLASDQISKSDVQFITSDGSRISGSSQNGCPLTPPVVPTELSCATGITLGSSDTEVKVRVAPAGLIASEVIVAVAPKNYCAVDIAFITASVEDGAVVISAPEYRSPCMEMGL